MGMIRLPASGFRLQASGFLITYVPKLSSPNLPQNQNSRIYAHLLRCRKFFGSTQCLRWEVLPHSVSYVLA